MHVFSKLLSKTNDSIIRNSHLTLKKMLDESTRIQAAWKAIDLSTFLSAFPKSKLARREP